MKYYGVISVYFNLLRLPKRNIENSRGTRRVNRLRVSDSRILIERPNRTQWRRVDLSPRESSCSSIGRFLAKQVDKRNTVSPSEQRASKKRGNISHKFSGKQIAFRVENKPEAHLRAPVTRIHAERGDCRGMLVVVVGRFNRIDRHSLGRYSDKGWKKQQGSQSGSNWAALKMN